MTRTALAAPLALLLSLAACSGSDDAASPEAGASDVSSAVSTPTDPSSAPPTRYPAFAPESYTYRLEVLCFCPQVGAVRVEVEDGEVAAATALTGRLKGKPAPEFTRLTINDIIDRANDPTADRVKVTWPRSQDHPTSVRIDHLTQATDDEVTYLIRKVKVTAG